jgi:HK97 family phage portal protein
MGFIQRAAEKELWRRAIAGQSGGLVSDRNLWRWANKMPGQMITEARSSLENPQTPLSFPAEWLLDIFNGGRTDSGIRVSEMTALQADAVLACVRIICNGIASLPLQVYERQMKDTRLAKVISYDHPLFDVLSLHPNPEMTAHTLLNVITCHALLWGNAYVEIQRDNAARVIALWPRNPARTRPVRLTRDAVIEGTKYPAGTLVYHTSETAGDEIAAQDSTSNIIAPERIVLAEDMIHILGLSLDGRLGQSTVYLARQIIGLALASEKYGAKFFGNGAIPAGVLTVPSALEPKAAENLRRSWAEAHGGENSHKTAVLEQGVDYKVIGIDPQKSQFLETRKYQRISIASVFNVPPHMVGEGESSKSTVEQTSIEFLNYCLYPWLDKYQQELKAKLFPLDNAKTKSFFVRFETHRLLYPNSDSRAKFYDSGKQWGWLNTNDIHELEDLNPVTDGSGEVYYIGVNMQDAANPMTMPHIGGKQNVQPGQKPELPLGGAPQNSKQAPEKNAFWVRNFVTRYARIYYPMFKDAAGRVLHRTEVDEMQFRRCFTPSLVGMVESISAELASSGATAIPSSEFMTQVYAYMEGMRFNLQGVLPEMNETYAMSEVRRAAETWYNIVNARYNPNHSQQPRHPDGTFHDGSTDFFIGRHGTTDDDVSGAWSGWRKIGLNEAGRQEIVATGEKLKGKGIKRIVSSELPRAKETAQYYASVLGVPMTTDWRLNALDLGELAGLNEKENGQRLQLYVDNPDQVIPGGRESIHSYQDRVNEVFNDLQGSNETTGPILAVTHSSDIAVRLAKIRNQSEGLENCSELLSNAGAVQINGRKIQVVSGNLDSGDAA